MIGEADIKNVKTIMEKARNLCQTDTDKKRFENLIKGFDDASIRYLEEVKQNARLYQPN